MSRKLAMVASSTAVRDSCDTYTFGARYVAGRCTTPTKSVTLVRVSGTTSSGKLYSLLYLLLPLLPPSLLLLLPVLVPGGSGSDSGGESRVCHSVTTLQNEMHPDCSRVK